MKGRFGVLTPNLGRNLSTFCLEVGTIFSRGCMGFWVNVNEFGLGAQIPDVASTVFVARTLDHSPVKHTFLRDPRTRFTDEVEAWSAVVKPFVRHAAASEQRILTSTGHP